MAADAIRWASPSLGPPYPASRRTARARFGSLGVVKRNKRLAAQALKRFSTIAFHLAALATDCAIQALAVRPRRGQNGAVDDPPRRTEGPAMFGKFRKKKDPPEPDRSTLVPPIKTHQFTAALQDMDIPRDQMPYTEP